MTFIQKIIRRFSFLLNILLAIYTLLVYQLGYAVNIRHWLGGFLMMTVPVVIVANLIFIAIWAIPKSRKVWLSVIIILIGIPLILRTFTWHFTEKSEGNLSIVSHNLMWCDSFDYVHQHQTQNGSKLIQSAIDNEADILCFQELYNNDEFKELAVLKRFRKKNPHYTYMYDSPNNKNGQGLIGLAIFSKYPLINKKEKHWQPNHNGLLRADVVIKKDTIRVINVQLKSMGVRVNKVLDNYEEDKAKAKQEATTIYHQLKNGFEARIEQVRDLEEWIKESPYPVIVCGDFNELPYGYAYGRVRNHLSNAFEKAGQGFGFTYNKAPKFVRIDNQFFDEKHFEVKHFEVKDAHDYSDHYAIRGEYKLK
jgi:endonuclease/exonuclease/phosphatase family metal-dependent hydrolase